MSPIDVAHVTTAHPHLDIRIFQKECRALADAGLRVCLLAVAPEDRVVSGVSLTALPARSSRLSRMILGPVDAWRALRHVRPRMIHVHDPELIPMAILWRIVRRRPAVFDSHEDLAKQVAGKPYLPEFARPILASAARLLEKSADRMLSSVVAATPSIGRNFRRAPVTLVQNFPWRRDYSEPAPRPASPAFCYVGALTAERGGLQMIEAVRNLPTKTKLILAGRPSAQMSTALQTLDDPRVDYRGVIPVTEVPDLIAESSAGLVLLQPLPNYVESQPTKLFEYMAAGRPFIASDFDFWRGLVGRFDCGFFVDPSDFDEVQKAMRAVAEGGPDIDAMGERGRAALVENFVFEFQAEDLIRMTNSLLEVRSRR